MSNLSGKKTEDFVKWLELIRGFLPGSMSIAEAKEIFLRKSKEEDRQKDEEKNQAN